MAYSLTSPVNYIPRVNSPYGYRNGSFHRGIDWNIPQGSLLLSPRRSSSGTAYRYYQAGGFGYYLYLRCDDGIGIALAHLKSFIIPNGGRFSFNTPLAYSDNTGSSTGPHLHMELHKKYGAGFTPQNSTNYILLKR